MKDGLFYAVVALLCFGFGVMIGVETQPPKPCSSLQILDCGHIVHNGDTVRFTTLPVK